MVAFAMAASLRLAKDGSYTACLAAEDAEAFTENAPAAMLLTAAGGRAICPLGPRAHLTAGLGQVPGRLRAASRLIEVDIADLAAVHFCLQHIAEAEFLVRRQMAAPFPGAPVREHARHGAVARLLVARLRLTYNEPMVVEIFWGTRTPSKHCLLDDTAHSCLPPGSAALAAGGPLCPFGKFTVDGMGGLAGPGFVPGTYARRSQARGVHENLPRPISLRELADRALVEVLTGAPFFPSAPDTVPIALDAGRRVAQRVVQAHNSLLGVSRARVPTLVVVAGVPRALTKSRAAADTDPLGPRVEHAVDRVAFVAVGEIRAFSPRLL